MESIIPIIKKLGSALKKREWQSCIDCLNSLSPAERKIFLPNHVVHNIPTLRYLAELSMEGKDENLIFEIVRLFADSGYDINKKSNGYCFVRDPTHLPIDFEGYFKVETTALMSAAAKGNNVFVKCLIRNGARKDLLDSEAQSAYHLAISNGNLSCFQSLIYITPASGVDETEQMKDLIYAYSLLQKAIENGRKEIVSFLIENKLCDPSKKAMLVMSRGHFEPLGKMVNIPLELIPLQVAILKRKWDIAAYLIETGSDISIVASFMKEHSQFTPWNSKIAGDFNSYELLLKLGDKKALPALEAMLINGIEKSLNCTSGDVLQAAVRENQPDFVEQIFNDFAQDTWNDESPSWLCTLMFTSPITQKFRSPSPSYMWIADDWLSFINKYTLLHFACVHHCSPDFIQKLLWLGANVNSKTTGITKVTPLHISIIQKQWEHARILIVNGADLESTAEFIRDNETTDILNGFNSIHMLIFHSSCTECDPSTNFLLSLMNQEERVSWVGVNEFYMAILMGSPECMFKLLIHCAKTTPLNILMWFTFPVNLSSQINIPLLHAVFVFKGVKCCGHIYSYLRNLIRIFATAPYNYDFNTVAEGTIERMNINYHRYRYIFYTPILFHILKMDYARLNNLLSGTLLEYDHVELNGRNQLGESSVEFVLRLWNVDDGFQRPVEIQGKVNMVVDTIQMLLFKGIDVSSVSINEDFRYHNGLLPIIKLLYRAGATITPSFFSPRPGFESNSDDIQSLKIWKEQFDKQCKFSLKHCCRLQIRSSIETVGEARTVMNRMPVKLRKYVWELQESSQAFS